MSSKWFKNKECEYYPCHSGIDAFSCLFCFCPLFPTCHSKECKECGYPHIKQNYQAIVDELREDNAKTNQK